MKSPDGTATSTSSNFLGALCAECGQIDFKIVVFTVAGQDQITPLCGRHFVEAGATHPEMNPAKKR